MRIVSAFIVVACLITLAVVAMVAGVPSMLSGDGGDGGGSIDWFSQVIVPVLLMGVGMTFLIVAPFVSIALWRLRCRHRRQIIRYEIVPFRADEAYPDQVRRLMESWHQQLMERWRSRPITGQPSIALEIVMEPDEDGRMRVRFLVALPAELRRALAGSLRSCYPNARLEPRLEPPPRPEVLLRLKKRESFIQPLAVPDEESPVVSDAILNEMNQHECPAVVQITLTPTPPSFDFYARRLFKRRERGLNSRRGWDRSDPGTSSELVARELKAGVVIQHRPQFWVDIRVGAATAPACRALSAAMRGASGGENRLRERPLYSRPGRLDLYRERLRRGWGNPIPSWRVGVVASPEVPGLWRLPSPGLTTVPFSRSSVPRVGAPPEVSRVEAQGLLRDERGTVGIRPQDKSDGLGLIGGQKTGKTSVLCQSVRVDAQDPDCALIVLMPKPGDAIKALSMVPTWRKVHFLDFEAPEFGINPLMAVGEAAMVADKVVDAFRDINMEGDIKGSSDRFLRQAAQAAIGASRAKAIPGPPNLWHMYRLLLPNDETFREQVVKAIITDPRFTDSATFFGRDLPSDLLEARVNTASKLDAPRNKILRLMVESLDKVLRHPRQLDLDEVVRNREVLIVDGKMGTFGSDNCRVMMQFILNMLYGTLQRQQQRQETERVRVAVKVDEAHLIINVSFADALATLRSAGLEMVAAWQYGEQIQDPKVRSGMMSLLRQRCMFSMGESADAREMTEIAMSVYTDMIRADPESRARLRFTPDTIFNLPNHHAMCSWISNGARAPAFIGQTIPLTEDQATIEHHLAAQRARGGFVPDRLPDPLPDVNTDGLRDLPIAVEVASKNGEQSSAPKPQQRQQRQAEESPKADGPDLPFDPSANSISAPNARPEKPGSREGAPDSYTELDFDGARGIDWPKPSTDEPTKTPEPAHRDLEILAALWNYRVLLSTQIHRRWWSGATLRAAQQRLNVLNRAGWVRRGRFAMPQRGSQQLMYLLTQEGFKIAQSQEGPRGSYIPRDAEWREPQVNDPRGLIGDLHANGWVLALQALAPQAVRNWRGPRGARLMPPRRRNRGEWIDLRPQDLTVGGSRRLDGIEAKRLEPVNPDAAVEVRLAVAEGLRFDLLVEIERGRGSAARETKLRRYDLMISGWARMLDRYQMLRTPPVVVFVAEDEPSALSIVRLADRVITGRLAKAGEDEVEWPYPGRKGIFVVCERDVHMGSLAAYQLPELPPELRERLHGREGRECVPRRVEMIPPQLLRRS